MVPLSRHSHLPELEAFVKLFRPRTVIPNTLDPKLRGLDWKYINHRFHPHLHPSTTLAELNKEVDEQIPPPAGSRLELSEEEVQDVDSALKNLVGEGAEDIAARWADDGQLKKKLKVIQEFVGHGGDFVIRDHPNDLWASSKQVAPNPPPPRQPGRPTAPSFAKRRQHESENSSDEETCDSAADLRHEITAIAFFGSKKDKENLLPRLFQAARDEDSCSATSDILSPAAADRTIPSSPLGDVIFKGGLSTPQISPPVRRKLRASSSAPTVALVTSSHAQASANHSNHKVVPLIKTAQYLGSKRAVPFCSPSPHRTNPQPSSSPIPFSSPFLAPSGPFSPLRHLPSSPLKHSTKEAMVPPPPPLSLNPRQKRNSPDSLTAGPSRCAPSAPEAIVEDLPTPLAKRRRLGSSDSAVLREGSASPQSTVKQEQQTIPDGDFLPLPRPFSPPASPGKPVGGEDEAWVQRAHHRRPRYLAQGEEDVLERYRGVPKLTSKQKRFIIEYDIMEGLYRQSRKPTWWGEARERRLAYFKRDWRKRLALALARRRSGGEIIPETPPIGASQGDDGLSLHPSSVGDAQISPIMGMSSRRNAARTSKMKHGLVLEPTLPCFETVYDGNEDGADWNRSRHLMEMFRDEIAAGKKPSIPLLSCTHSQSQDESE